MVDSHATTHNSTAKDEFEGYLEDYEMDVPSVTSCCDSNEKVTSGSSQ